MPSHSGGPFFLPPGSLASCYPTARWAKFVFAKGAALVFNICRTSLQLLISTCVYARARVCVRACLRARMFMSVCLDVGACVLACLWACARMCVCRWKWIFWVRVILGHPGDIGSNLYHANPAKHVEDHLQREMSQSNIGKSEVKYLT